MNDIIKAPDNIIAICRKLKSKGFEAYLVGGALRDSIMGRKCSDFDITTSAFPEEMKKIFKNIIPYGDFGTMLLIDKGMKIEITPYRNDAPGRKPTYKMGGTIDTDLSRRDFTINSMAYDPIDKLFIDPFNGREDIKNKLIRCTGSTKRIWEDPLRALRAARFEAQLGFDIEKSTLYALMAHCGELETISKERIRDELNKLLVSDNTAGGLYTLVITGLMEYILPELMAGKGVEQPGSHIYDVLEHNIIACAYAKGEIHLRLAALLHDVGKPFCIFADNKGTHFYGHEYKSAEIAKKFMTNLRYPNNLIKKVVPLVQNHMFTYNGKSTLSAARRLVSKLGWDGVYDLIEIRKADRMAGGAKTELNKGLQKLLGDLEEIKKQQSAFSIKDLKINGNDLKKELGLKESPIIGKILNRLLEEVLEYPEKNSYENLLGISKIIINDK